jgi:hypothetical protein
LEKYNVGWTAINQPYFDTSTPHGRAFVNQSMMWAELEAQNDSVRILDVFESKVKYGEVLSGNAPLGYSIVDKHLVPNEDADTVRDIFNFYVANGSYNATIMYIKDKYNRYMTISNLKKCILKNKKYIGKFRTNDHYCEPLIDDDLFNKVQNLMPINVKSNQKRDYIFSSLLICEECGNRLISNMRYINKKSGKQYRYKAYRCSKAYSGMRCENRKVFFEATIEKYLLENIKIELNKFIAEYSVKACPLIDNTVKKQSIKKKIEKLKELYVNELITLDEFKIDKDKYTKQLKSIPDKEEVKDIEPLKELLNMDINSIYNTLDAKEKRSFWRSIIKEIRVDSNKNCTIVFL